MEEARAYLVKRKIKSELANEAVAEATYRAFEAIKGGKRVEPLAGWLVTASKLIVREMKRKSGTEQGGYKSTHDRSRQNQREPDNT
ncbi:MAG: hypothetical protein FD180_2252 [Planctomycetota bacterium]|nr:MAG: hypothetical protein FD180_2252 [Planctomycetota bacterium]